MTTKETTVKATPALPLPALPLPALPLPAATRTRRATKFAPRAALTLLIAALCAFTSVATQAQPFPNRPVRLVIPFPPGAATDALGRLLGQRLGESWGQSVVVDNRPGAGSIVGAQAVASAPPDGYTVFMGHIGTHGANPALYAKLPYDPVKDFAPVTLLVTIPNLLAVHPAVPATSVRELIELARARPGALNVGSPGISTSAHLIIALFRSVTGADMTHVPFKGAAAAMQGIVAGEVQVAFDTVTSLLPQAKSGKVRLLAITSRERSPAAPEVAPLAESGVPGFDVATWFALFVPGGTPRPVIDRLNADVTRAMQAKEMADRLLTMGMNSAVGTPEQLAAHVQSEIARWGKVVREANIKVE
jgi:tripartite-type tricarboxylate transporter receptor subunit TctC